MKTITTLDASDPEEGSGLLRRRGRAARPVVITGGAGFIGSNLAARLLELGREVIVFDNFSRPGVEANAAWLQDQWGDRLSVEIGDVRDRVALRRVLREAGAVFHFAAQVAVTTSLVDPLADFEVNARGTLNVLEELRTRDTPPPLLLTSTNKVYGGVAGLELVDGDKRWMPTDPALVASGLSEQCRLDFRSPYGCSKGTADSYVLDWARTYGLPATVFRMSCIYGPRQLGTEDQGWVAHFLLRALAEEPITIYGDGKQVRDVLWVDDLVDAMLLAEQHIGQAAGQAFNMGGGAKNALSLLELLDLIAELRDHRPEHAFEPWRPGDQRYYVSDTSRFRALTGWQPSVGFRDGVRALHDWLSRSRLEPVGGRSPEGLARSKHDEDLERQAS